LRIGFFEKYVADGIAQDALKFSASLGVAVAIRASSKLQKNYFQNSFIS
jgi:hypothetical protein